jgi:hypothetical protein
LDFQLSIEKSVPSGYHILGISGDKAAPHQKTLLEDSALLLNGVWATLNPHTETTDITTGYGLKQLVYISFIQSKDWVEDALEDIFCGQVGHLVNYQRFFRNNTWFHSVLVDYSRD